MVAAAAAAETGARQEGAGATPSGPAAIRSGAPRKDAPLVVQGIGTGWRPEIAGWVAGDPGLGFCEVIAEAVAPAGPPRGVVDLRERGVRRTL